MKDKVLIVTPCLLPVPATKGGAVLTLVESIIKQNEVYKKMDLSVISSYDEKAEIKSKEYKQTNFIFLKKYHTVDKIDNIIDYILGLKINKNKPKKKYLTKYFMLKKIKKKLKENTYDKVIFQNSGYLLNAVKNNKMLKKYEGKLYYHLHNDVPNNINKKVLKKCKLLLISNYLKEKLRKISGDEIIKNCYIVRNGFDCNKFSQKITIKEKNELKKSLGIEKNKKIVLYTGRLKEEKGIGVLAEAIKKINNKDIILLIIGSSNFGTKDKSKFEETLAENLKSMEKSVVFTGYIPYEKIWMYYQIADIAVLPSIWNEPAGLTMLEASAAGIPLITTNSGGIPEYQDNTCITILNNNKKLADNIKKELQNFFIDTTIYKKKAIKAQKLVKEKYNEDKFYKDFIKSVS